MNGSVLVTSGLMVFNLNAVKSHIAPLDLECGIKYVHKERAGHVEFGTAVYRACAPLVDWRYLCVYVLVYITRTHIAGIHVVRYTHQHTCSQ